MGEEYEPDCIVSLSDGRVIENGVKDSFCNITALNWTLENSFSFLPDANFAVGSSVPVAIVIQVSVTRSEHFRRTKDRCGGKLLFDCNFAEVLRPVELRPFPIDDRLRIWVTVQSRYMDESLDSSLTAYAGDSTSAVHVNIFQIKSRRVNFLTNCVDHDIRVFDCPVYALIVLQEEGQEQNLSQVSGQFQASHHNRITAIWNDDLCPDSTQAIDDSAAQLSVSENSGHRSIERGPTASPSFQCLVTSGRSRAEERGQVLYVFSPDVIPTGERPARDREAGRPQGTRRRADQAVHVPVFTS